MCITPEGIQNKFFSKKPFLILCAIIVEDGKDVNRLDITTKVMFQRNVCLKAIIIKIVKNCFSRVN